MRLQQRTISWAVVLALLAIASMIHAFARASHTLIHESADGRFTVIEMRHDFGEYCEVSMIDRESKKTFKITPGGFAARFWERTKLKLPFPGDFDNHFGLMTNADGTPCFTLWCIGQTNWQAWDLKTGEPLKEPDQHFAKWDAEAERLAVAQTEFFKKRLAESNSEDGQNGPWVNPRGPTVAAAYRFLTRRKRPEDRRFLGELLHDRNFSFALVNDSTRRTIAVYSYADRRRLGDALVADFDGRKVESFFAVTNYSLGSVSGVVQLPQSQNSSGRFLRVYLVAKSDLNEWPAVAPFERVELNVSVASEVPPKVDFTVDSIRPGEYLLKALWSESLAAPAECLKESGSFQEESETALTVEAGKQAIVPIIFCTRPARVP